MGLNPGIIPKCANGQDVIIYYYDSGLGLQFCRRVELAAV